jgi:DNA-binding XRE family transcriptional regulator
MAGLARLRKAKGLRQWQLAEQVDVYDAAVITDWELGHKEPLAQNVRRICSFFNCKVEDLYGIDDLGMDGTGIDDVGMDDSK